MKTFILFASLITSIVSATAVTEPAEKSEDMDGKEKDKEKEQEHK
ncbi:hypothetical protein [Holospora curviuscula]|uniref:Pentapeptide MXKDX repeat protein n=1 Tax=Holospora curviuscula TaxID=1082868 RepID=A0A2S5R910_9PROT|nr:hypothetical protein [Holospora curviuscula]PPE03804.1 hypothetical protein HCUR_00819 [Holospora curviuscula]